MRSQLNDLAAIDKLGQAGLDPHMKAHFQMLSIFLTMVDQMGGIEQARKQLEFAVTWRGDARKLTGDFNA